MWLQGISQELGIVKPITQVYSDSQSAIHLSKNSAFHERTKHIDVRLYFVRDIIAKGQVKVEKIKIEINPTDMLTKQSQCLSMSKLCPCSKCSQSSWETVQESLVKSKINQLDSRWKFVIF